MRKLVGPSPMKFEKECIMCGKKFLKYLSEIKNKPCKYCSQSCGASHRQLNGGLNRKSLTMKHKGYILQWAPKHPKNVKGYVAQHRLIMESKIKRYLRGDEHVHHLNHVKSDNRIENLELLSASDHQRLHHSKIFVILQGNEISFTEACRRIGRAPASIRGFIRRKNMSRQEAINFYAGKFL